MTIYNIITLALSILIMVMEPDNKAVLGIGIYYTVYSFVSLMARLAGV